MMNDESLARHSSFSIHHSAFQMIHSMTGFGRASGALSDRFFLASPTQRLNHRFLAVPVRLPEFFWELDPAVRAIASDAFSRGKIDISVRVTRTQQPEYNVRINAQIANTIVPQLRALAEELGLGSTFSGSDLMRVPDLLQVEAIDSEILDDERDALAKLIRDAFAQMIDMRRKEGESLHADSSLRVATIRKLQERLAEHREEIRAELLASYQQRVREIAAQAGVQVPEERIAQETVIMVERGDIAEELTRLAHHVDQLESAIGGREAAGKKRDFLSQEMLREINTM